MPAGSVIRSIGLRLPATADNVAAASRSSSPGGGAGATDWEMVMNDWSPAEESERFILDQEFLRDDPAQAYSHLREHCPVFAGRHPAPHAVAARARTIREILAPRGRADAVRDLAVPVPLTVMCWLFGTPTDDIPRLHEWTLPIADGVTAVGEPGEELEKAARAFRAYFSDLISRRRGDIAAGRPVPDDLLTQMITFHRQGWAVTDAQLLGFCRFLLAAGSLTTTILIGNMIHILLERPDLTAQLRSDHALVEAAVEECLRLEPPVRGLFRTSSCPVTLEGVDIDEHVTHYTAEPAARRRAHAGSRGRPGRLRRGPCRVGPGRDGTITAGPASRRRQVAAPAPKFRRLSRCPFPDAAKCCMQGGIAGRIASVFAGLSRHEPDNGLTGPQVTVAMYAGRVRSSPSPRRRPWDGQYMRQNPFPPGRAWQPDWPAATCTARRVCARGTCWRPARRPPR
jgi:hypothetical protein